MRTVPDKRSDDLALARAAGRGEAQACRELAERLLRRVRLTVTYLAAGDRDADDLMQVSLIEILRVAGTYRGESSLERWADRIAVRTALRALKQRRRREQIVQLGDDDRGSGSRLDGRSADDLEIEVQPVGRIGWPKSSLVVPVELVVTDGDHWRFVPLVYNDGMP